MISLLSLPCRFVYTLQLMYPLLLRLFVLGLLLQCLLLLYLLVLRLLALRLLLPPPGKSGSQVQRFGTLAKQILSNPDRTGCKLMRL